MNFSENISKNRDSLIKIGLFLFLASIFFPIRHVILGQNAFLTGAYSDFTSYSSYLSDFIILGALLFGIIVLKGKVFSSQNSQFLLLIWVAISVFLNFHAYRGLGTYFFSRLILLIVLHETIKFLINKRNFKLFLQIFVVLAVLQSILASLQFFSQTSLGLYRLGEVHLSPATLGIAKIMIEGVKFIRGYGTFPHPNLLAAFLVAASLFIIPLLMGAKKRAERIVYLILLFINLFGLLITFSRAGYLALGLGLIIFSGLYFYKLGKDKQFLKILGFYFLSLLVAVFVLKPFLLTRAVVTDAAVTNRLFYDKIGLLMTRDHVLFGVGPGTSVLHMERYTAFQLQPWQIQPIHNYFIIVAAELGLIGLLILLFVFWDHVWPLLQRLWQKTTTDREQTISQILLLSVFSAFLLLMMFDHYFYTIWQTQVLLWLVLGLMVNPYCSGRTTGQESNLL